MKRNASQHTLTPRRVLLSSLLVAFAAAQGSAAFAQATGELVADVSETATIVEGVPGGSAQFVATLEAEVVAINRELRQVTLKDAAGNQKVVDVPPEAINFDQVNKGDRVKITLVEEHVVAVLDQNAPHREDAAGAVAERAEPGSKPQAVMGGAVELVAIVTSVDLEKHTAKLMFGDGTSRVVPVRPDVALTDEHVGREVLFTIRKAVALKVEKP